MAGSGRDRQTVRVGGRRLAVSSLDKVLFPGSGTTKGEVLAYYARIADVLLPHLADRAVTRIRYPHGTGADRFFEKNPPSGCPDWIPTALTEPATFPVIEDLAALTYFVNLGSLEFHVHQWRVDGRGPGARRLGPDRLVIDLDPGPGTSLVDVCQVALLVRERLEGLGLPTFPVTSGSAGMQVYSPLPGGQDSDTIRDTVQQLARQLSAAHPKRITWLMAKDQRPGRIFLDWSQNVAAKTTVCPYSLRGKNTPYAACPRTWDEVTAGANAPSAGAEGALRQLLMDEVLVRVERDGDLAADLLP